MTPWAWKKLYSLCVKAENQSARVCKSVCVCVQVQVQYVDVCCVFVIGGCFYLLMSQETKQSKKAI